MTGGSGCASSHERDSAESISYTKIDGLRSSAHSRENTPQVLTKACHPSQSNVEDVGEVTAIMTNNTIFEMYVYARKERNGRVYLEDDLNNLRMHAANFVDWSSSGP